MVVVKGLSEKVGLVLPPGVHNKVEPTSVLTSNDTKPPSHMVTSPLTILKVGNGLTVISTCVRL